MESRVAEALQKANSSDGMTTNASVEDVSVVEPSVNSPVQDVRALREDLETTKVKRLIVTLTLALTLTP